MALDELLDEHEQGERVRDWLRSNAPGLIGGLVLGLCIIFGWRWWTEQAHAKRIATGDSYRAVQESIGAGNLKQAAEQAQALADSAYAGLVALDLAKAQVEAGESEAAIATLRAASQDEDAGLAAVVRQRLARLLIDTGKAEEALGLLAGADDAASRETRGDAHFALGRAEQAATEYQAALRQLDVASPQRMLVELKLGEAGGAPEAEEVES